MNIMNLQFDLRMIKRQLGMFAVLACVFTSTTSFADENLDNFTSICTLDESCAVDENTLVAFGSLGHYTYKTISGNFQCSPKTFAVKPSKLGGNAACLSLNPIAVADKKHTQQPKTKSNTVTSGTYAIISVYSGKALTVEQNDESDDALLSQRNFNSQKNQLWEIQNLQNGFFSISAEHSGKALENQGWNINDGAKLQQFSWINSLNQHWKIKDNGDYSFQIISRVNGHVVDLFEMNKKEGGEVCLWTYWGGSNQRWRFVPIELDSDASTYTE